MTTNKITNSRNVILIVGPTAVGKTALSLALAEKYNGEIVSSDSRQVYKYLDIGTAKPSTEDQKRVRHHFIDIKFPNECYSAGIYSKEARLVINDILRKNRLPIVVGGSGLYIRALVDGFDDVAVSDASVKQKLKQKLIECGLNKLYEILKQVDPVSAEKLHPNDTQRILRALEVWELSGIPLSEYQQQKMEYADFQPVFIGLNMKRSNLYRRIENRVDDMLRIGLVNEVTYIKELGYSEELTSLQTVGYKEIFDYLKEKMSYDEAVDLIKQRTRNYAKRQLTWFKKDIRISWFMVDDNIESNELFNQIATKAILDH